MRFVDAAPQPGRGRTSALRASRSRRAPAAIRSRRASGRQTSRASVRRWRPASISSRTLEKARFESGYAPSGRFEGMSRTAYAMAPSTRMSKPFSMPGNGPRRTAGRVEGSADFVVMSFALRGAPCGDDPDDIAPPREDHHEEAVRARPSDPSPTRLDVAVPDVVLLPGRAVVPELSSLGERDSAVAQVERCLVRIPVEVHRLDATRDPLSRPALRLIHRLPVRARTGRDSRGGTAVVEDRIVNDWVRPVGEGSRDASSVPVLSLRAPGPGRRVEA